MYYQMPACYNCSVTSNCNSELHKDMQHDEAVNIFIVLHVNVANTMEMKTITSGKCS